MASLGNIELIKGVAYIIDSMATADWPVKIDFEHSLDILAVMVTSV